MATMRSFRRSLSDKQMAALAAAASQPQHWWKDLLKLWRPNGVGSGDYGLRLAVRDGYLNFYRRGQSVARVSFDRGGSPMLSVHAKYVVNEEERQLGGLKYAALVDREISHVGLPTRSYEGVETLKSWISVIDRNFTKEGGEKPLIDQLLDQQGNAGVVDLEMGLPAWGTQTTAPRMDVVTIEDVAGRLTVIFGEVKRVDDSRIRCGDGASPEVLDQLEKYECYLAEPLHCAAIAAAYQHAALRVIELGAMARSVGDALTFGSTIERAASGEPLDVAKEAVLIVMCTGTFSEPHWMKHRDRLHEHSVKLVELGHAAPMNLGGIL